MLVNSAYVAIASAFDLMHCTTTTTR